MTEETILDVIRDDFPQFLAESFAGWRGILAAAFGLPVEDMPLIERLTARTRLPMTQVAELYLVCGRRAGKSLIAALIAVYFTAYRVYPSLVSGETAQFVVVSASKQQAKTIKRYYLGLMRSRPELAAMVKGETEESVSLANGIDLVVLAGNFRTVRGGTILSAIVDEAAFLRSEEDGAANTDEELIGALLPGMATIPDAMLMVLSSPHREQGVLFEAWRDHFGKNESDDVLVVQADTRSLNPTVRQEVIDRLYAKDPVKAASEYGARFRTDLSDFVTRAAIEACVSKGVTARPRAHGFQYRAHVDAASGTGADSFTLAIAHNEGGRAVLDVSMEWRPPFKPSEVIKEICSVVRGYGVGTIVGDAYAGGFAKEQFEANGMVYQKCEKNRSQLYLDCLPLINSQAVALLDDPRTVAQFLGLERRTARGGRDSIDHAPGRHDDVATSVAGALVAAGGSACQFRVRTF